jgi:hypothetical protein
VKDEPKTPKVGTAKLPKSTPKSLPERKNSKFEPIQTEIVKDVSQLINGVRKGVATLFVNAFIEYYTQHSKDGEITLKPNETADSSGKKLAIAVEHALYMELSGQTADPSPEYRARARSNIFNLKQNPELRVKILTGDITPEAFATMSSEEMAPEEMQKLNEELKKEAEKQAILVTDDGPRIRRTHKGEELVGDTEAHEHNDSIFTAAVPRARETDGEIDMREVTPAEESEPEIMEVELPETISHEVTKSPSVVPKPLKIDTEKKAPERRASQFNINDIWSNVKSTDSEKHKILSGPYAGSPTMLQGPVTPQLDDPEIDNLLKDEDIDSPPYSPPGHEGDDDSEQIWRGTVLMNNIAEFKARAHYFGGVNVSSRVPWAQLLAPTVIIDGRIDTERANNYLCESHYATSTDVVVIRIVPSNDLTSQQEFHRLCDYFSARSRYGVIGKDHTAPIKDIYILPVEAHTTELPAILKAVPGVDDKLRALINERVLLLTSVIKAANPQHSRSTSIPSAPIISTDPTPNRDVFTPLMPPQNPALSLIPSYLAEAPTLRQLLDVAPNIGAAEMRFIGEILEQFPLARTDTGMFQRLLQEKQAEIDRRM